ncbi:MAG: outer membrane protein TolC [Planctomycetota bacterium]
MGADVAQRIAADALKVLIYGAQEDPEGWDAMLVPSTESPVDVSVDNVPKWVDAFDVAMKMRPDVRMQDQDVRLAEIRHDRSISDRRIGLDFSLSVQSQGLDTTWERAGNEALEFENLSYTAGLALNAPIQNRTAANAEMAADRRHKSSLRSREQLRIQVISEIRDAVRQMHYQSLAVSAAATSLRAADRQLAAEQARYENDLSTNFQVLEFQMQFVEAMNNEQTARTNFAKARFQLQVAQGILGGKP